MPWFSWKGLALLGLAALSYSPGGLPADALPVRSALARALESAWRLNPQAAALDARAAEAAAAQELAAGLSPEPGSISVGSRNDRFNRHQGQQEYEVELAVPLWLPGQKSAQIAEAAHRGDELQAQRAALRLGLAGELREAWWSLAATRGARNLAARRLETARALQAEVQRRFQAGESSRIDANLARSEVAAAEAERDDAEAALFAAEQALRLLSGQPAPDELSEESPEALPEILPGKALRESARSAASFDLAANDAHPQLLAAAAAARSARARLALAQESPRAAPELALRVVRERALFDEPFANSVGIKLKIPFSSGAQVRRAGAAAQAEADQADAEMQRAGARIASAQQGAQRALQAAGRQMALADERRALAADNLRLGEKAFALGEADLATLLRLRAAAHETEAASLRQRLARGAAISRLKQALGVLP